MLSRITIIAALLLLTDAVSLGQADEAKKMREFFREIAARYEVAGGELGSESFDLRQQPVLNWNNPQRRTQAGAMFIWTERGRPKVAMCIYPSGPSHLECEFQSISDKRVKATDGRAPIWEPSRPGIEFKRLGTSQPPSPSRQVRTRQMRALAREFTVNLKPRGKPSQELRMLTTPVYRYPERDGNDDASGWIDGAVFTFVQGTDPEALLLLEAVRDKDETRWQYGMARMSVVPTETHHDSELVWKSETFPPNRYSTYFVIRRVERDDAAIVVFE